jgi:DNA-binding IclR family transcriptional regulator
MRQEDDIQALRLGIQTLRLLNEQDSVSCAELAAAFGLSRPAAYRLISTLSALGYIAEFGPPRRRRYRLAVQVRSLSDGFGGDRALVEVSQPIMLRFTQTHGWPLALSIPAGDRYFVRFTTDHATTRLLTRHRAGQYASYLESATGLVCLANLPEPLLAATKDRLARSCASLPQTSAMPSAEQLDAILQRIREQGYAQDTEPRQRELSLAIPIRCQETFIAALTIRYMSIAANGEAGHQQRLQWLRTVGAAIERELDEHQASDPRRRTRAI